MVHPCSEVQREEEIAYADFFYLTLGFGGISIFFKLLNNKNNDTDKRRGSEKGCNGGNG